MSAQKALTARREAVFKLNLTFLFLSLNIIPQSATQFVVPGHASSAQQLSPPTP